MIQSILITAILLFVLWCVYSIGKADGASKERRRMKYGGDVPKMPNPPEPMEPKYPSRFIVSSCPTIQKNTGEIKL